MLKQAIPNVFVKDFQAALAYYTGSLGFRPLFVYGEIPFYAHVARDEAILAIRHVTKPVIDHTAGEALLSAFIEVQDVTGLASVSRLFSTTAPPFDRVDRHLAALRARLSVDLDQRWLEGACHKGGGL
jgi:catechol 2,3-dioxygenase-like lactoylglutathione lyase family enzyme